MFCPNCETVNNEDARFCVECGFPLSGAIARGAGAASPSRIGSFQGGASSRNPYPFEGSQGSQTDFEARDPADEPSLYESSEKDYSDFSWEEKSSVAPATESFYDTSTPADEGPGHGINYGRKITYPEPATSTVPPARTHQDSLGINRSQETAAATNPSEAQDDSKSIPGSNPTVTVPSYAVDIDSRETPNQESNLAVDGSPETERPFDDFHAFQNGFSDGDDPEPTAGFQPLFSMPGSPSPADSGSFPYQGQTSILFDDEEDGFLTETLDFGEGGFASEGRTAIMPQTRRERKAMRKAERKAQRSRGYQGSSLEERKGLSGKQKGLIIGGILVVVAALIAVVGFALGIWGGVVVPNVVGLSQEEATRVLEEEGFTVKALQVKSDEIEGRVLVMDPGGGSFAPEGSEVIIHIATARTIPQIVGESLEEAQRMLADAGYTNVVYKRELTDETEGIVLAVNPAPETRAKSSIEITVTVSENYKVPDISGMTLEEAQAAIKDAGLESSILYIDTADYPDGTVIGTDPAAGTKVTEGATVAITISRTRGVELIALAEQTIAAGETVEIGGVNYQIESVDSLSYQGNDTVAFTITAKPFVTFFGETLYASSSQTVTGSMVFSSSNEVLGIT